MPKDARHSQLSLDPIGVRVARLPERLAPATVPRLRTDETAPRYRLPIRAGVSRETPDAAEKEIRFSTTSREQMVVAPEFTPAG